MANPPVRIGSYNALTGDFNCWLPYSGDLQAGSGANGQGGIVNLSLDLTDAKVRAVDPWDATIPGFCVLGIDVGGVLIETYDLLPRQRSRKDQTINIQGAPQLFNYWNQQAQATDYSTPPTSPLAPSGMLYWTEQTWDVALIAAQIFIDSLAWDWATGGPVSIDNTILGQPGCLVNGLVPNAISPVVPAASWVAPTFPLSSMQYVAAIFQQLAGYGYGTGIDFNFITSYSGNPGSSLIGNMEIWYPRSGVSASQSEILFNLRQSRDADFSEDAGQQGTTIIETGVQGAIWIVQNVFPLEQGWPSRDKICSHSGAQGPNIAGLLQATAQSDSYQSSFPVCAPVVTMPLSYLTPQASLLGTDCYVFDGPTPGFPNGMDNNEWRIVAWNLKYPAQGDPTVDWTLNLPPAMTATAPAVTK